MRTLGRRPFGILVLTLALVVPVGIASSPAAAALPTAIVAQRGDHNTTVSKVQRALTTAGFPPAGGVDGRFGPGTQAAVNRYQTSVGLPATGIVDTATAVLLKVVPATALLRIGNRGPEVVVIQQQLMAVGITLIGGADGVYGSRTATAVKSFQTAHHLSATGSIDAGTAALLAAAAQQAAATSTTTSTTTTTTTAPATSTSTTTTTTTTTAPTTTVAPAGAALLVRGNRSADVKSMQQLLITAGFVPQGGADGIYGAATEAMVRAFQSRSGLPVTGAVDAATLAALQAAVAALSTNPGPAAGAVAAVPGNHGAVNLDYLPVPRTCAIRSSFGAPRSGGRSHQGLDILYPLGTPIYAERAGTITKINKNYAGSLAGNAVYLTLADGTYFFHAHLDRFADGLTVGMQVPAGALIGYIGSTGNASGPHLHLEIHPRGGAAVDPYPIVKAASGC